MMGVAADDIALEIRAIRTSLRAQHLARLDQEAELNEIHARLVRLTQRLGAANPPYPQFSDGDGI